MYDITLIWSKWSCDSLAWC